MFDRHNGRKESIVDYDPMFRNLLEQGKKIHPELFTTGVFILDSSLRRMPRGGSTTKEENNNMDTQVFKSVGLYIKYAYLSSINYKTNFCL